MINCEAKDIQRRVHVTLYNAEGFVQTSFVGALRLWIEG